jgi:hypothetical protein
MIHYFTGHYTYGLIKERLLSEETKQSFNSLEMNFSIPVMLSTMTIERLNLRELLLIKKLVS